MTFRLNKNEIFYTYARCDLPLEDILAGIRAAWASQSRQVVDYIISSEEHKDEGLHRHCYIRIDRSKTNSFDARLFDLNGFHPEIETVRNKDDVIGYVAKDGNYITNMRTALIEAKVAEYRNKKKPGRGDSKEGKRAKIWNDLVSGVVTLANLTEKYPCQGFYLHQWKKSWDLYKNLNRPKPQPLTGSLDERNLWLWGDPGVGKTKYVFDNYPRDEIWDKPADKWWTGYNDEPNVIINDIGENHKNIIYSLKNWTEHEPFNGPIHCEGPRLCRPQRIFVTSNYSIGQLLDLLGITDPLLLGSLKRRFKQQRIVPEPEIEMPRAEDWEWLNSLL